MAHSILEFINNNVAILIMLIANVFLFIANTMSQSYIKIIVDRNIYLNKSLQESLYNERMAHQLLKQEYKKSKETYNYDD